MQQVRDSEVAAAVMGVNVPVYKAAAFTVSSMYAGLGGVFLALAFGRIVPESFGFLVSIDFLVMIVIGGLGSIGGAIAGAVLISALPQVLNHYSDSLPLVAEPGSGGLQAAQARALPLRRRGRRRPDLRAARTGGRGPPLRAPARHGSHPRSTEGEHGMSRTTRALASWLAAAALLAGAVAGCGGKGEDSGGSSGGGESGSIKTGPGVTDKEISLGLLTDLSGVFAPLAKPIVQATQEYWKEQNAKGGVCDRTIKLVVKDHGYDPQKAVVQYRELSDVAGAAAAARLADHRGAAADAQEATRCSRCWRRGRRRCWATTSSSRSAPPTTSR